MMALHGLNEDIQPPPPPSVYQDVHGNYHILICTDYRQQNAGIYQYNVTTNQINLIHKYENNFYPRYHTQFMDEKEHILYIFGGVHRSFLIFNLTTKATQYYPSNLLSKIGRYPSITFIPSPLNEIHAYDQFAGHLKYKIADKNAIKINSLPLKHNKQLIRFPKLMYSPFNQQMMVLGADHDDAIFYCNIKQHLNQTEYIWTLTTDTMPHCIAEDQYNVILGFETVIFAFYFQKYSAIYCMDLFSKKWFKSEYKMTECYQNDDVLYVIKIEDNALIWNFINAKQYTLNLFDLIPNGLIKAQRQCYKSLITGYIKQQQIDNNLPHIATVLINLTLKYFQLFT